MTDKIIKSKQEWQKQLTPQQYQVCRQKGTGRSLTGAYWNSHERGTYRCVCCGAALFGSNSKFDLRFRLALRFGNRWNRLTLRPGKTISF